MKCPVILVLVYGLLILVGGIFGYIKAGSLVSLMMGSGFAFLVLVSGFIMLKNFQVGSLIALILASILTLFFSYRMIKTESFMPGGLMAILSLFIVLSLLYSKNKQCFKGIK